MTDNIISFEEFRLRKKGPDSPENAITQILKKDLRKQEDLIDWYLFHHSFNKYKLFLYSLFYNNHQRLQGSNPNAGYIQVFNNKQMDSIVNLTKEALIWLDRKFIIVDCKDKSIRKIGAHFPYDKCNNYSDFFKLVQHYLLKTDNVLVFKEISQSKLNRNKAEIVRSLIKITDDAHFKNINPLSDTIFIDYASFLEKAWENIGLYIDVLPTHWV